MEAVFKETSVVFNNCFSIIIFLQMIEICTLWHIIFLFFVLLNTVALLSSKNMSFLIINKEFQINFVFQF